MIPDHVLIPSTSRPGYSHRVQRRADGSLYCTCPSAQNRQGVCAHIRIAAEYFATLTAGQGLARDAANQARQIALRVEFLADRLQTETVPSDTAKACWDALDDIDTATNRINGLVGKHKV
jgi:hypothetical protein